MSEIQELEAEKVRLQKQVAFRDQILKLSENHEFRKVIHDGFMNEEAARCARMAGEPTMKAEEKQAMLEMAMAAGHLQRVARRGVGGGRGRAPASHRAAAHKLRTRDGGRQGVPAAALQ